MLNPFDVKAKTWDENPLHVERSEAVAAKLLQMIPVSRSWKALEFGAGTGILSLLLKDHFNHIVLMDSSMEMIGMIRKKITDQGIRHMTPVLADLEHEDFHGTFNIIYTQMVFHHVGKIETVLHKFSQTLISGGYLAIADLYPEDGSFHGNVFTGHLGFDPEVLSMQIQKAGFDEIQYQPCFTIKKTLDSGALKEFPIFLLTAVRS